MNEGASDVDYQIIYGHAVLLILEEINKIKPSLVVMGNQGRGRIKELFLGSVSQHVVRQSAVPVLLVPWLEKE